MYGSSLMSATRRPRLSSKHPIDDAARPFPRLETTPPVTKIYLGIGFSIGYPIIVGIAGLRRISGFVFSFVMPRFKIFLDRSSPLRRGIECFLNTDQTSAEQARSFLCASFKFLSREVVRLAKSRQAEQPE